MSKMSVSFTSNDNAYMFKCWCGKTLLTELQYKLANFDSCPYCMQKLGNFKIVHNPFKEESDANK